MNFAMLIVRARVRVRHGVDPPHCLSVAARGVGWADSGHHLHQQSRRRDARAGGGLVWEKARYMWVSRRFTPPGVYPAQPGGVEASTPAPIL